MEEQLRNITLRMDKKTVDYLIDEVRKKRQAGLCTAFADTFLIRLVDALNNQRDTQVFRVKEKPQA
jgi:hypothetical protein